MYPSQPAQPKSMPAPLAITQTANGYIVEPRPEPGYAQEPMKTRVFNTVDDLANYLKRHFDDYTTMGPEDFTTRTC